MQNAQAGLRAGGSSRGRKSASLWAVLPGNAVTPHSEEYTKVIMKARIQLGVCWSRSGRVVNS